MFTYTIERSTDDGWKPIVENAQITFTMALLLAEHASSGPPQCQAQVIQHSDHPADVSEVVAVYEAGNLIVLHGKAQPPDLIKP